MIRRLIKPKSMRPMVTFVPNLLLKALLVAFPISD